MRVFLFKLINKIFKVSFITYLGYLGLEILFEGLISNYFDLNILLVFTLISGAVLLFFRYKENVL